MRTKKAIKNVVINLLAFSIAFIPNLIIRKIFLECLGSELLGLTSLYSNIIGWLSIVELGIGGAIIFSLYKPFEEKNYNQVRGYIKFYGKFYRIIGLVILSIGLLISPFLSFLINDDINLSIASIGFILYLVNTVISYVFSHRLCILNVDQEAYKITICTTISKLLISLFQYIMLKLYPSFILFIFIQIIINLIYFIAINMYISIRYKWINSKEEYLDEEERKKLIKNVKAMFMHKIGNLIVYSTDNIIISKFIGLISLSKYTNYQIVISAFQNVIGTGLNGITASIGSMLTDGDKEKAYDIHKKLFFINFWITSLMVISLYNTLNQFIVIWVGKDNLLNTFTFVVIMINLYFSSMRGSVEQFQSGSGNFYQDRYAPILESIINLVTSLILAKYIGLSGIFLGTLISNITVVFWTKPYIVYKYVFDRSIIEYFKMYFKYLFISIIPLLLTNFITRDFKNDYSLKGFILNCIVNIVIINISYIVVFFKSKEFRYYLNIAKSTVLHRNKNKIM